MNFPMIENGQVVCRPVKLYKRRNGLYVAKVDKAVVGYVQKEDEGGYSYGYGDPDDDESYITYHAKPHQDPFTRSEAFSELIHLAVCRLR